MGAAETVLQQLSEDDAKVVWGELADLIRIVNPSTNKVLYHKNNIAISSDLLEPCHDLVQSAQPCENCISKRAIESRSKQMKTEFVNDRIFLITALPVNYNGVASALEIVRDITNLQYVQNTGNIEPAAFWAKRLELAVLAKIQSYANQSFTTPQLLRQITEDLQAVTGLSEVAIYLTPKNEWYGTIPSDDGGVSAALSPYLDLSQVGDASGHCCFYWQLAQNEENTKYLTERGWTSIAALPMQTSHKTHGYIVLGHRSDKYAIRKIGLESLSRLVEQVAILIEHQLLLDSYYESQRLETDLRLAVTIRQTLMPKVLPKIPGCVIAVACQPAAVISGDYYDFIPLNGQTVIVIGDLKGKGIGAALLMAHLRSLVRAKTKKSRSPQAMMRLINEFMIDEQNEEMLASLVYGVWDHAKHAFYYCNAGHPYPLLYRYASEDFLRLDSGGLMIGVLSGENYEEGVVKLAPGDVLIFYTDGITEAESGSDAFGEEQLKQVIVKHKQDSPDEIRDAIVQSVERFTTTASLTTDDRTVVVLKYFGLS